MIALIDADIVVYQAAARSETTTDWGDEEDIITISGSKSETRDSIDSFISDLKEITGADRVLLAFTDANANYRKQVYPLYKSNRKAQRKPVTFQYGKDYAKQMYDSMTRPGLEADDIMGILATGDIAQFAGPRVVCSIDKDMRTIPCKLYNWMKPKEGVVEITEADADFEFYKQVLTGDATDGYPGIPGIGPVKAEQHLVGSSLEPWPAIVQLYESKGLTEDDAITQARCARILRASDYDFESKQPILWTPPQMKEEVAA